MKRHNARNSGMSVRSSINERLLADFRQQVTAVPVVFADGWFAPLFFVLPGQHRSRDPSEALVHAPTGSRAAYQPNAWMDQTAWKAFFHHFENSILPLRRPGLARQSAEPGSPEWEAIPPILLIFDSNITHLNSISVLERALACRVIFLNLPAHCTHLLQPLDSGLFSAPKKAFRTAASCATMASVCLDTSNGISELVGMAGSALQQALTTNNIRTGSQDMMTQHMCKHLHT